MQEAQEQEDVRSVGNSGQISLGKSLAGKRYRVVSQDDGTIVLTPVVVLPESELWILREPHASRIRSGMAWAAANPPRATDLDELFAAARRKRRSKRRG